MKYLCLVYREEDSGALSGREPDGLPEAHLHYDEVLRERGYFIAGEVLQPVEAATTVRVRRGKVSVTDGFSAGAGVQLAEFVLIEARDLNEAIRVASRIPSARLGRVEVRPIREPTHS